MTDAPGPGFELPLVTVEPHELLDARVFVTAFAAPIARVDASSIAAQLEGRDRPAAFPSAPDEAVTKAVRDLLRRGGYKPTGRGKPASEYLVRAAIDGALAPINAAVDACNVASLHSGLPISVVDLERVKTPLRIAIAPEGSRYVFNLSGQEIDLGGLLCLFDADGPCANAVKDSQRTKTHDESRRTLSVVWGTKALGDRAERTALAYRELIHRLGGSTWPIVLASSTSTST